MIYFGASLTGLAGLGGGAETLHDTSDYAIPVHGEARGLPHVELEIRQDLIADADGQRQWALRLARLLPPLEARFATA